MPVIPIAPWPKQSQHYQSEMLSNPLPRSLFKVLRAHYASRLVDLGEMQWSTLTWFQHLEDQREYRLAFGTCADVFDFRNVEIVITPDGPPPPRRDLAARRHRMKLRLGTLRDCCRIV